MGVLFGRRIATGNGGGGIGDQRSNDVVRRAGRFSLTGGAWGRETCPDSRHETWEKPCRSSRIRRYTTFQTGRSLGCWTRRGWACQDKSVRQVTTSEASAKIAEMVRRIADWFQ